MTSSLSDWGLQSHSLGFPPLGSDESILCPELFDSEHRSQMKRDSVFG